MKNIFRLLTVSTALIGGLAIGSGTIAAQTSQPSQPPSQLQRKAPPPPCVTAQPLDPGALFQTIKLYNGCGTAQRVKIIGAFVNGSCVNLRVRQRMDYDIATQYPYFSAFEGLEAC